MTCPRCQHDNPMTAKFCGECGNRLGSPCPACRVVNPPANKFCHECGSPLAAKGANAAASAEHPYVQAIAPAFQGMVWHAQGELGRAVPRLEASLDTCREHELVVWRPIPSAVLGHAYVVLGRDDSLTRTRSLARELGLRARWENVEHVSG